MAKLLDLSALFLGVLALFFGAFAYATFSSNAPFAVAAAVLAVVVGVMSYRLNQVGKARSIPPPIKIPDGFRAPFVVHRRKTWLLFLAGITVFLAVGGYAMFAEKPVEALLVGAFAVATATALWFLAELRKSGSPVLVIDDRGIATPEYGLIPWAEIDRMVLLVFESRGSKQCRLSLSVYEREKYLKRRNPIYRWLSRHDFAGGSIAIDIPLIFIDQEPGYVEAVARHFRAKYAASIGIELKTGDLSIDKRSAEAARLMSSLRPEDDVAKIEPVMRRIQELHQQSFDELRQDARKARTSMLAALVVMCVALALYLGWFFVRK